MIDNPYILGYIFADIFTFRLIKTICLGLGGRFLQGANFAFVATKICFWVCMGKGQHRAAYYKSLKWYKNYEQKHQGKEKTGQTWAFR